MVQNGADNAQPYGNEPSCVIEGGHPAGTPATWRDADVPVEEFAVCDDHKHQYDYSGIRWERLHD